MTTPEPQNRTSKPNLKTEPFQVILIQVKSNDDEEFESLDITNMPKNVFTLKREILKTLGIDLALAEKYRMRKINFDGVFKIKNDHDVVNLKHENRVEIIRENETQKKSCNVVSSGYRVGR